MSALANLDQQWFLREIWQQRPLLIRQAFPDWQNPLSPDELAGLACEEGVEARLITRKVAKLTLESGPFAEQRFAKLGRDPWTLLVQAVDHQVPAVAALVEPFRFIPDWRIDDVMVSYANDGGGVGPHFDQYDVFLVQGLGQRRWRVGPRCDATTPLQPHDDLRLLASFTATDEWVLEPGDMLYVPPGFAHDGVGVGDDCMTYSIGFRAPAVGELIEGWAIAVADTIADDERYADPALPPQDNPGEITREALERLHALATKALADPARFADWFGKYATQPKYPEMDWRPEDAPDAADVAAAIGRGETLLRNPAVRCNFIRQSDGTLQLFVGGQCLDGAGVRPSLIAQICAEMVITLDQVLATDRPAVALVTALLAEGALAFADDEPDAA